MNRNAVVTGDGSPNRSSGTVLLEFRKRREPDAVAERERRHGVPVALQPCRVTTDDQDDVVSGASERSVETAGVAQHLAQKLPGRAGVVFHLQRKRVFPNI